MQNADLHANTVQQSGKIGIAFNHPTNRLNFLNQVYPDPGEIECHFHDCSLGRHKYAKNSDHFAGIENTILLMLSESDRFSPAVLLFVL